LTIRRTSPPHSFRTIATGWLTSHFPPDVSIDPPIHCTRSAALVALPGHHASFTVTIAPRAN